MRRRVVDHIPAHEAERQLKLGSGGLRDVEFAVQLLQLVHGRADDGDPAADDAERAGRADPSAATSAARTARRCTTAYAFLRTLEHRIQLLPAAPHPRRTRATRRRCAGSAGAWATSRTPVPALDETWQHHRREVRRLHEKLFYRPLLDRGRADARRRGPAVPGGGRARGWPRSASPTRPPRCGTSRRSPAGVTRTAQHPAARCCRRCSSWFADAPDPDAGLFGFRRISESLGAHAVVPQDAARRGPGRRAAGPAAGHLALRHRPARARAAGRADARRGPRAARAAEPLIVEEMLAAAGRQRRPRGGGARDPRRPPPRAVPDRGRRPARPDRRGRRRRRRSRGSPTRPSRPRCDGRRPCGRARQQGLDEAPTRMAIVAMGRYGGFELSYGSDADVMFVHEPAAGRRPARGVVVRPGRGQRAAPAARAAGRRPGARGRRRPAARGQAGPAGAHASTPTPPTTRSGRRSGSPRRCCAPTPWSATRTLRQRFTELIDPLRFPADGHHRGRRRRGTPDQGARRPASGCRAAPTRTPTSSSAAAGWPTSSGPCSCCRCGTPATVPGLRTSRTLEALAAAREAGLLVRRRRRRAGRGLAAR